MNGVVELMESAQAVMPPFVEMPARPHKCRGAACPLFAVCEERGRARHQQRGTQQEGSAGR